jgi:acetyltransferase
VLQSGGLLNQVLYSGIERGFGFSKVVDSGNEASLTTADYVDHLIDDDETDVIVGVIEAFHNPRRFLEVAEMATREGIPIVILKMARSEKGGEIAASHTGALTASDDVVVAALEQYGVVQVNSFDMLIEVAELFSKVTQIPNNEIGVLEISGGGCALFSDAIAETDLDLPPLSDAVTDRIQEDLPPIGVARNPVDMAMGWGSDAMDETFPSVLEVLDEQTDIEVIISRLSIPQDGPVDTAAKRLRTIERFDKNSETTFAVVSRASGRVSDEWTEKIKDTNIPFLQEYHKGIRAIDHLWQYSTYLETRSERTQSPPDLPAVTFDSEQSVVTEHRAKQVLTELGLDIPSERAVTSESEAVSAADTMGYPVGLKILSPDIPHKTDIGGVKIGLETPEEVSQGYNEIMAAVETQRPDAEIEGILVQQMVDGGIEMLIGSKRSKFGQAVVCGMGGVYTEVMDDTSIRIAPFSTAEAKEMLCELEGYELLTGARGQDAVAVDALAETLSKFSAFVAENEAITEADLNPVIVTEDGAYIVDALFHVDSASAQ